MLIIEQDDSLLDRDRRFRYARTRAAGTTSLRYEHRRNATDQLLGIPDALAWSRATRDRRRRIAPVVAEVRDV